MIAKLMQQAGSHLIIEFVPKQDEKIVLMLEQKRDVYEWYTEEAFRAAFSRWFNIHDSAPIGNSGRTLYRMSRR
jgi:hypothetical protein